MYKSRRIWSFEIFNISLSIRGSHELNPCIHASSVGDIFVFFSDKKNNQTTPEQEHSFRGGISLVESNLLLAL